MGNRKGVCSQESSVQGTNNRTLKINAVIVGDFDGRNEELVRFLSELHGRSKVHSKMTLFILTVKHTVSGKNLQ